MRNTGALFKYVLILAGACVSWASIAVATDASAGTDATTGQEVVTQGQPVGEKAADAQRFDHLVTTTCEKCHNSNDWAGGVAMDTMNLGQAGQDPKIWENAVIKLRGRMMPPAGHPQPSQADIDAAISYLETSLDTAAADEKSPLVGHVPLERLTREEFAASVKDLVGVTVDPKQVLPTEIEVDGFSNIAGALGVPPTFLQQYLAAARKVAQLAVGASVPKMESVYYGGGGGGGGQAGPGSPDQITHRDGFPLGTRGGVRFTHVFPADGEYHFNFMNGDSIDAGLYPRGMETEATVVFLVDDKEVARREIGGPQDMTLAMRDGPKGRLALVAKLSNIPVQVTAGSHTVTITFIERSRAESNDPTGGGKVSGMPIIRDGIQVVGPFSPHGLSMSTSRAKIFVCMPRQADEERPCAEQIARHLATEAYRRPVTDDDVQVLMKFYDVGRSEAGGFNSGVTELVTAILSSPDFLFRSLASSRKPGVALPLTGLELASRLSFFLWSEGPDAELMSLATSNRLTDPKVLDAQVARMLKDPRAEALVNNFAFSWLNMGTLDQIEPDDKSFTSAMREDFETEIRLFLSSVLLGNHSVTDLLDANYTFVNEALARQYGIPGVLGPQFRRVILEDPNRWGLMGKGAVLLRTSYGDRTSPVLRGEYILDRIIGSPPDPPPPGVNTDLSLHLGQKPTTVRARLEAHRANPTCKACHGAMDPYGLALENFDVTGKWRTVDAIAKQPIDPTSELDSGIVLHGPVDLRNYLTRRADQFPTTVTRRLMMYALNRELEYYDMPEVRQIVRDAAAHNYTFASIITGIVNSDAFRRQGPYVAPKKAAIPLKTASLDTHSSDAIAPLQER